VNGNGHLDLLVSAFHDANVLYINDGNGNFERMEDSGLGEARGSTTMALTDITGNGYPDLYITNYKEKPTVDEFSSEELGNIDNIVIERNTGGEIQYELRPPFDEHYQLEFENGEPVGLSEIGVRDELYLNKGGYFEKVPDTQNIFLDENGEPFGIQPDWGLSAKFQDINNDGSDDLYVCNDFHTPDRIWINQGDGTFRLIDRMAIRNHSFSCMDVDFSDINRDGKLDIFTTEMLSPYHFRRLKQTGSYSGTMNPEPSRKIGDLDFRPMYNRNSLFMQREDNTYAEISYFSGVEASGWSWATRFMDVNLNGYEDLIINTGFSYDHLNIDSQIAITRRYGSLDENFLAFMLESPTLELYNRIYRNNGDLTFSDVSWDWGMDELDISHGMAVADLNNDGVQDLAINRLNREAVVYENRTNAPRILVCLNGNRPNTQAIGSKIELMGGTVNQKKEVSSGGEYLSGSDPAVMFAANSENDEYTILVTWPDGKQTRIENVKGNRIYKIDEPVNGAENVADNNPEKEISPMFLDISERMNHTHHEEAFVDFEVQNLLPFSISQDGPGVAWLDYNGDQLDDLLMPTGKGGEFTIIENLGEGRFNSVIPDFTDTEIESDQTAVIGWREDEVLNIVIGRSNYEMGNAEGPSATVYKIDPSGSVQDQEIPGILSSTGPVTAADVNGDGYMDLFIGGRFNPGRYPENADSRLFLKENGEFKLDEENTALFSDLGLVTGALFVDFTDNGYQDLLLSTEWGTLRLFENNEGEFTEITSKKGLDRYKGYWKSISVGDFNNDGLPDIVAGNMGLNSFYSASEDYPVKMYYQDLNSNGRLNIIEAYYSEDMGDYVPRRKLYEFQTSRVLLNRMSSHEEFAESTLPQILGESINRIPYKEMNTLEHMLFLNTDSGFDAKPLPVESQFSNVFHSGVADFNNDGNEDLFLTQNFFAVSRDMPRFDAGRGIMLLGDGNGNFNAMSGLESGIRIYGEQRGAAFSDINKNGKIDLAVSQNGAETRLFMNNTESPGYSITLRGPSKNRNAIGSSIRLVYDNDEKGPRRYIKSGTGYWSQDSFTQILGAGRNDIMGVEVNWFDGNRDFTEFTSGYDEHTIEHSEAND
jgi:hypothetical protein